jgi:hypothetical protein
VKTIPNRSATSAIGNWSGMSTYHSFRQPVAPSIFEASSTSVGIDARPATKITTANGRMRHAWTSVIASSARFGRPSH